MALLFMDGFDHYATADITKKWSASSGSSVTINSSAGRRSSGAIVLIDSQYCSKGLPSSYATIIVGFAIKPSALNISRAFLSLWDGSVEHLAFAIAGDGRINVYRGQVSSGTLLGTGTATLSTGSYYYVEVKATIDDSAGVVVVKVNGVTDIDLSSKDTRNGGTATVTRVILGTPSAFNNGLAATYDDLYVCDTSGSTNNDFLGDCRIDTKLPTGDGHYTQLTPSTGTAHYATVDESTPNTTDYNSGATSGDRDSYTFPALTALVSQTVYGVQINAAALKSDSGARSLGTMSRLSSTDKDGAGAALSTSQLYISEIQETDPASAAWTEANVNAAEFGVKVTA